MPVVIAPNVSLSQDVNGGQPINTDNPIVGYHNLVTASNLVASSAQSIFPVTNLANVSTNLKWRAVETSPLGEVIVQANVDAVNAIDYVGIAGHNFGTAQIAVTIEGTQNRSASPIVWTVLNSGVIPANDGPLLFRFASQAYEAVRIRMAAGNAAPSAAVVFVGELLTFQRRIYVGHTPAQFGRKTKIINGMSESGNFLGRIVQSQFVETTIDQNDLDPVFYRDKMEPFIVSAYTNPFFFAWRPGEYSAEAGYMWLASDPRPSNALPNGFMNVSLSVRGIVK